MNRDMSRHTSEYNLSIQRHCQLHPLRNALARNRFVGPELLEIDRRVTTLSAAIRIKRWKHIWGHPKAGRFGPYNTRADELAKRAVREGPDLIDQARTLAVRTAVAPPLRTPEVYPFMWILTPPSVDVSAVYTEHSDEPEILKDINTDPCTLPIQEIAKATRLATIRRGGRLAVKYRHTIPFSSYRPTTSTSFTKMCTPLRAIGLHQICSILDGVIFCPFHLGCLVPRQNSKGCINKSWTASATSPSWCNRLLKCYTLLPRQ